MLLDTRLDGFGQILFLLVALALGRCIWLDSKSTNFVSRSIPGVTSRDARKWAYLRENISDPFVWHVEVETASLMLFIGAAASIFGLRYGDGSQHDRAFGWLSLCGCIWIVLVLTKDAMRRRRLLVKQSKLPS